MSTTVDNRVVEMQFDNKHFETNVQTSLSTLEKLKRSLNLSGASKGLENINATAKKFDMSAMGGAVETVRAKFSALEVMAVTTLANITNSAVNTGKRIVSAFTIEPIKTGLAEYETQINAVQTILANTEHKGTTLDQVNSALDELNTYADKTIYNFTQMTRNIGTFTAAGVDLKKSVTSIKGIANLAAVSGSTSQQASTAMYQLSQALAAGKISLMDWNSVVNAGMGGEVFQNALKRTARVLDTGVDAAIEKYGTFRQSLTEGGWLTAEVLTETLTQLSGAYTEAQLIEKGYSKAQAEEIVKLAKTAEDAATKVKTFTQLIDTLKESAQSGWTQTWELLVGDFEQAKTLWTGVSDAIGSFINKTSESRNTLLEGALTSNWDKLIKRINDAGIETTEFEKRVRKVAKDHDIDLDKMIEKYGSLEKAFKSGAISSDILKESVGKASNTLKKADLSLVDKVLKQGAKGEAVKQVENALKALGYDLVGKKDKKNYSDDGYFGTLTKDAIKDFQKLKGLKVTGIVDEKTLEALKEATTETKELEANIDDLIDGIDKLGGRELLIESFKNIFEGILSVVKPITSAFRSIFPPITVDQLYKAIEGFKKLTDNFKLSVMQSSRLHVTFKGLFALLDVVKTIVVGALGAGFKVLSKVLGFVGDKVLIVTDRIGRALIGFRKWALENNNLINALKGTIVIFKKVGVAVKNALVAFWKLPMVQKAVDKLKATFADEFEAIKTYLTGGMERITAFIDRIKAMDSISLSDLGAIFKDFKENVLSYFIDFDFKAMFDNIKKGLTTFKEDAKTCLDAAGVKFDALKEKLGKFVEFIKSAIPGAIAIALGIGTIKTIKKIADAISTLASPFEELQDVIKNVGKSYQKYLNAKAFKTRTEGVKNLAISIAILAGSIAVLTALDPKKMWGAVGALAALATILVVLSIVANKMGGMANFTPGAVGMVIMSAAILLIANALKTMEGLDTGKAWGNLLILGAMMAGMATIVGVLSKFAPKLSTGSLTFVSLALAITIMVNALRKLDKMELENVGQSIAILIGIVGALSILAATTRGLKFGSLAGVIAMAIGLKLMVGVMDDIAEVDTKAILDNIGGFILVFGSIVVLMWATQFAGQHAAGAGVAIFLVSLSMLLIVEAIEQISKINPGQMDKAVEAIGKMLLVFGAVVVLSNFAGEHAAKAGVAILAMSAAMLILTGAIAIMSMIRADKLNSAVEAVSKLMGMFAILVAATGLAKSCVGTLVVLTVAVGVLSASVAVLSLIDPTKLDGAVEALSKILVVFGLLMVASKFVTTGWGTMAAMAGTIVVLGGVIYLLSSLPIESTLAIAESLSMLILSLSASCFLLSLVPVTGALTGVASLAVMIGGIGLLMAAISGLNALFPDMNKFLSESLPTLELIGNGIGSFLGGIVGGIAEGATSSLPDVGTNLSDFMTNAQTFIDGAKGIDSTAVDGVSSIVSMITSLTGANILDGVGKFLTGESSMTKFAAELPTFGEGLKKFSDSVVDLDTKAITAASDAATTLSGMAGTLPNEGGLISAFTGDNSMDTFGKQLPAFGTAIKDFADNVDGIKTDSIDKAADAGTKLATMAQSIPSQTTLFTMFGADTDMSIFGDQLPAFGIAIKGFADNVDGIKTDSIDKAADAGSKLATMAESIPNTGGFFSKFTGDNDLSTFSTQIGQFATGIKSFADNVDGIKTDSIDKATDAGGKLAAMADLIPNTGGLLTLFTGDNSLSTFSTQLQWFGLGIKGFADKVDGIKTEPISTAIDAAKGLVEMANSLPESGGLFSIFTGDNSMETFGKEIKKFGEGLAGFAEKVSGIDTTTAATATSIATRMSNMANKIPEGGYSILNTFGDQLTDFGIDLGVFIADITSIETESINIAMANINGLITTLSALDTAGLSGLNVFGDTLGKIGKEGVDKFLKAFSDAEETVSRAINSLVENLLKAIKSKKSSVKNEFSEMMTEAINKIGSRRGEFRAVGEYIALGLIEGIKSKLSEAKQAGEDLANAAKQGAKNASDTNSPSRVFITLGEYLGEGYIIGMEHYVSKSYSMGSELADSAKNGLSSAISKVSSLIENGIDSQPTIRPVLDLSDITSGVNTMNGMFGVNPSVSALANVGSISSAMNRRNQNGANYDVVSAIKDLGRKMGNASGDTYNINGVTYDDGSTVSNAIKALTRAIVVEGRV